MEQYLEECAEVFLKEQGKLFDEPVAETIEEAKEFLEDCFAQVFENISEVRAYLDEEGMDVSGVSDEELAARKAKWQPREPKVKTGYLARYASMVTSGNRGAILEVPKAK